METDKGLEAEFAEAEGEEISEDVPGEKVLSNERWEKYSKFISLGVEKTIAYMRVYESENKTTARRNTRKLLKNDIIKARVGYLKRIRADKNLGDVGVNLRSVIQTCVEILETTSNVKDKLAAITTLDKLKVFDGESRDEGQRMDPTELCEYLASFAAGSAKELGKIPDGLKGLMERLMDLTGASVAELMTVLDEIETVQEKKLVTDSVSANIETSTKSEVEF